MSVVENVKEGIVKWVFTVALKKGVGRLVQVIMAWALSATVAPYLAQLGIQLDPAALEVGLTALLAAKLEVARNYLKVKHQVGWL